MKINKYAWDRKFKAYLIINFLIFFDTLNEVSSDCNSYINYLKNDITILKQIIFSNFNNIKFLNSGGCNKAYSSCDNSIKTHFSCYELSDKNCSDRIKNNINTSKEFPVLRFQNIYQQNMNLKDLQKNQAVQELACAITQENIYKQLKKILDDYKVSYQYISSYKGTHFTYPARLKCKEDAYCPYDRPFYCLASSGLKNIFIVIDKSILLDNEINKVIDVEVFVSIIYKSLTVYDRIILILFDEDGTYTMQNEIFTVEDFNLDELLNFLKKNQNKSKAYRKSYSLVFERILNILTNKIFADSILQINQNIIFLYTDSIMESQNGNQIMNNTISYLDQYLIQIENFKKNFTNILTPFHMIYTKPDPQVKEYGLNFLKDLTCKLNGLLFQPDQIYQIKDLISKYCLYLSHGVFFDTILTGKMNDKNTNESKFSIIFPIYQRISGINNDFLLYVYGVDLDVNYLKMQYGEGIFNDCLKDLTIKRVSVQVFSENKECTLQILRKWKCPNKCKNFQDFQDIYSFDNHNLISTSGMNFNKLYFNEEIIYNYDKINGNEIINSDDLCCLITISNRDKIIIICVSVCVLFPILLIILCLIFKPINNRRPQLKTDISYKRFFLRIIGNKFTDNINQDIKSKLSINSLNNKDSNQNFKEKSLSKKNPSIELKIEEKINHITQVNNNIDNKIVNEEVKIYDNCENIIDEANEKNLFREIHI